MPTNKQKIAAKKAAKEIVENSGKPMGRIMVESGYSEQTAKNPKHLTDSKGWQQLMDEILPDDEVAQTHKELLKSYRLDHMTFPLGPKTAEELEDEEEEVDGDELEAQPHGGALLRRHEAGERTTLTDKEITDMLAEINCRVRRIVHGEQARHVYFWTPNDKARKDAVEMAYKLKGHYAPLKIKDIPTGAEELTDEQLIEGLQERSFILNRYKQYGVKTKTKAGNSAGNRRPNTKQEKPKADLAKRQGNTDNAKQRVSGVAKRVGTPDKKSGKGSAKGQ